MKVDDSFVKHHRFLFLFAILSLHHRPPESAMTKEEVERREEGKRVAAAAWKVLGSLARPNLEDRLPNISARIYFHSHIWYIFHKASLFMLSC